VRERTIARNYASALLELGLEHGEEERYARAFAELSETLAGDDRIQRFLATPKVEASVKESVVRQALEGRVPERFLRFVTVVMRKRRQTLLPLIGEEYRSLLDVHAGRMHAEVTLARTPDEATKALITERLSTMLGKAVVPHFTVNPEILGGLVVRYGDRSLDGSLRRQLLSLKRDMMHATLPELPARA
jgi:F-type H+-transporting ATPase subunit delta